MKSFLEKLFGHKVGGVRVVPLFLKIVSLFVVFLLVSNFSSNYINLTLNKGELIKLLNQLMVKDLKELYVFANNQEDIYNFNNDLDASLKSMIDSAKGNLKGQYSLAMGLKADGKVFFMASESSLVDEFEDKEVLDQINNNFKNNTNEAAFTFRLKGNEYLGVYKYNSRWDIFLIRAEELKEFYKESDRIFQQISLFIVLMTLLCTFAGIFFIRDILKFVHRITEDIMVMQEKQQIALLNMENAPNDDVTYLGMSFNGLAFTVNNLMEIFRKFVARDVARRAYKEREIRLEGSKQELVILFSDIKGFTNMTEALGNDIIKLLNIHYDKAISVIHREQGIIGSIIGDALLAIYGAMEDATGNKSLHAINSAYAIHEVAASLREQMRSKREELVALKGDLSDEEDFIYRAVLLEVGVGIDGGEVFYGNIGSELRMTNTVIGDNVNSSSRLEGLTRIYKVPVIVSEFVMNEVLSDSENYYFQEIDLVQVKGKTEGKRIFWPIPSSVITEDMKSDLENFSTALTHYYDGSWKIAHEMFSQCHLALADVFCLRTQNHSCPEDWNGVWTMTTK